MKRSKKLKDPAPKGMRQQVLQSAAQAWREQPTAIYLGRSFRLLVRFEVTGLRRDGSPAGHRPVRHFFAKLPVRCAVTLWYVVASVFILLWIAIQMVLNVLLDGSDLELPSGGWRRKTTVIGPTQAGAAVAVGRSLRAGRGHLWLVTTSSHVGLLQATGQQVAPLWQSTPGARPSFARSSRRLEWPDGSTIALDLPGGEARAYRSLSQAAL